MSALPPPLREAFFWFEKVSIFWFSRRLFYVEPLSDNFLFFRDSRPPMPSVLIDFIVLPIEVPVLR